MKTYQFHMMGSCGTITARPLMGFAALNPSYTLQDMIRTLETIV
jgi:hypothetical protein